MHRQGSPSEPWLQFPAAQRGRTACHVYGGRGGLASAAGSLSNGPVWWPGSAPAYRPMCRPAPFGLALGARPRRPTCPPATSAPPRSHAPPRFLGSRPPLNLIPFRAVAGLKPSCGAGSLPVSRVKGPWLRGPAARAAADGAGRKRLGGARISLQASGHLTGLQTNQPTIEAPGGRTSWGDRLRVPGVGGTTPNLPGHRPPPPGEGEVQPGGRSRQRCARAVVSQWIRREVGR